MAKPVYSVSLLAADIASGDAAVVDLVEGYTYVLRDITWVVSTASDSPATLQIELDGQTIMAVAVPLGTYIGGRRECRVVAPGPSTLSCSLGGLGCNCSVEISGYQLT